ncbi:beta-L-arabinofuranosidase domain-containing protein [Sellimonas sp.]|uniref:beta-L-arabinofuranosidase domain-containing protein n=1 Tax=Sellimonas sp. TaxID=2021466 RepID=UPI00257CA33C|nr:beta-L-arabinofuranosidase domain-containing protein [Sellimonas sp.]
MKAEEIVKKDMEALYLGNLNTVEADLELPVKGRYGSDIRWRSEHEVYLKPDGKIRRPAYGMGNRTYSLWGTFSFGKVSAVKEYKVCILEEHPQIRVKATAPVHLKAEAGKECLLPPYLIVYTEEGETLMHQVLWEGGSRRVYRKPGNQTEKGVLDDLDFPVEARINVVEKLEKEEKETKPNIRYFDQGQAVLEGESRMMQAQDEMHRFLLSTNDDQMLYNFREAAKLDTKGAEPMTGWDAPECSLRGHTTGHYLSALALCYKATRDEKIRRKAEYMIEELAKCQEAIGRLPGIHEGFLSGYSEEQFDKLEAYAPYPDIWAPYYTLHKILAGLLDCYEFVDSKEALSIAKKIGKWVYARLSRLSQEQRLRMWSIYIAGEYGGMNDVLARLYALTGEKHCLDAARFFDNEKLFFQMEQKIDALDKMHANQHIPQMIGAMELFKVSGEKRYYDISLFFWDTVVKRHTYAIGGTGEGEMFHCPDCIGNLLSHHTAESCASYNMLKLTKELYQYAESKEMIDYYERTLLNHILATREHGLSGESVYFTPLAPGGKKVFERENSCCHGTGMESHFKYADMIYAEKEGSLIVNLFVESSLRWEEKDVFVRQKTDMDVPGKIQIEVQAGTVLGLKIRDPYWNNGNASVRIDGTECVQTREEEGYLCLSIPQGVHDIQIEFICSLETESPQDRNDLGVFRYGPYILAAVEERGEYLEFQEEERPIRETELQFLLHGVRFRPLFDIEEETYHVYWKKKD